MREGEVFRGKAASFEQGNRQGVAEDQGYGGGGGRGQVQWTGFLADTGVQVHFRSLGQGRLGVAGHADQGDAQALDQRQQGDDFGSRAGVGQGEDHVVLGDHAHVAVAGLGRMHEEGGGAGAGQGSGDLLADVTGLAHADDDDPALAGQQQFAGLDEIVANPRQQAVYRVALEADGALGGMDEIEVLAHVQRMWRLD